MGHGMGQEKKDLHLSFFEVCAENGMHLTPHYLQSKIQVHATKET